MLTAYLTQKSSKLFFKKVNLRSPKPNEGGGAFNVVVDTTQHFQRFRGFGGAFTESAQLVCSSLSEQKQQELIDAYFSEDGLRYKLARIPMHTTDFAKTPRTYVQDGDESLDTFNMDWDEARFEFFRRCNQRAGGLFVMVATWSPPAWMKDNNEAQHGGKLLDRYKPAWAEYYCRFIEQLRERDINVDCLSVQNEPEAVQTWESCIYTAEEEALFLRDYLVPTLKKHNLDVKIVLWDHNRDAVVRRVLSSFSVEGVRDLVWGIGYHWYCSTQSGNLSMVHAIAPDKALFLTECCNELAHDSTTGKCSYVGLWEHGERYGKQIINDFNNYSEGWIDWNICLDMQGGPTYVGNFCEAPIMVDAANDAIHYMASYYYIGHFSKFITVGATRVYCANDAREQLYSVAFVNPDGTIVTIIENTSSRRRSITLTVDGKGTSFVLRPHSIITILI